MAKRPHPPRTLGPGGKALTKRQKAEGIAKWAELLAQEKAAKASRQENGQTPASARALPPHRDNRPSEPNLTGESNGPPRDNRPSPPNPEAPVDPLFDGSDWNEDPEPPRTRKKKAKAKARKGKTPKTKAAPVSIDTEGGEKSRDHSDPVISPGGADARDSNNPSAEDATPPPDAGAVDADADGDEDAPAGDGPPTLTAKQARFVEEFLVDLNATAAARRAGYSKKTAKQIGAENLTKPDIQAAIAAAKQKLSERCQVQLDDITRELARMGFANLADYHGITSEGEPYIDLSGCSRGQLAALQDLSVEDFVDGRGEDARLVKRVRIRLGDKKGALALLAELLGHGAKRKVELSGNVKVEGEKRDALAETIRRMETEDLRRYDQLAREQEMLLAKTRTTKETAA